MRPFTHITPRSLRPAARFHDSSGDLATAVPPLKGGMRHV
jgi:hypothetical protein